MVYLYYGIPTGTIRGLGASSSSEGAESSAYTGTRDSNEAQEERDDGVHLRRRSSKGRRLTDQTKFAWYPVDSAVYPEQTKILVAKIQSHPQPPCSSSEGDSSGGRRQENQNETVAQHRQSMEGRCEEQYTVVQMDFGSKTTLKSKLHHPSEETSETTTSTTTTATTNVREPTKLMAVVPVPRAKPDARCWYNTKNCPPIDLIENCFPGTQKTEDNEPVMGGSADTVVSPDKVEQYELMNLETGGARKDSKGRHPTLRTCSTVNEVKSILKSTESSTEDTTGFSTSELDEQYGEYDTTFLCVELDLRRDEDNLSFCLEYTHPPVSPESLFVPSRRLLEREYMSYYGDIPPNIRWNTSVYSIGTIRKEDWSGGGKDPETMFASLRSRFASGSFRKIVPPRVSREHACGNIAAHIENWLGLSPVMISPKENIRFRKIMAGPNKDMFVRLADDSDTS